MRSEPRSRRTTAIIFSPWRSRCWGGLSSPWTKIYTDTKKNNPYIATNKTAIMSLFEACDQLIALRAENNALKTELTYYKVKANEYAKERRPDIKPTPMEELADKVSEGLFEHLKNKDDK